MARRKQPEVSSENKRRIEKWLDAAPEYRDPPSERQLARQLDVHRSLIWYVKQDWRRAREQEEARVLAAAPPRPAQAHVLPPLPPQPQLPDGRPCTPPGVVAARARTIQEWQELERRGGRRVLFSVPVR